MEQWKALYFGKSKGKILGQTETWMERKSKEEEFGTTLQLDAREVEFTA